MLINYVGVLWRFNHDYGLNGFINGLRLRWRQIKNSFVMYSETHLCIGWKCFNFHLMLIAALSYGKFEIIQLQREEPATKSSESKKMLFIL